MWGCCDMFVGWLALDTVDTVDRMQIRSHFTLILHLATRHCCYWLLLYHITHPSPHQQTVNNKMDQRLESGDKKSKFVLFPRKSLLNRDGWVKYWITSANFYQRVPRRSPSQQIDTRLQPRDSCTRDHRPEYREHRRRFLHQVDQFTNLLSTGNL